MEVRFENGWSGRGWVFDPRRLGLFREFESATTTRHTVPAVDVIEDNDAYHFYFDMPGLKNEAINAGVEDGRLVVDAERTRLEWPQAVQVRVAERSYGTIRRAFELPNNASREGIEASYKDGVLAVRVAKKSDSKSAKILIN
jgi:HSP20 family protein